MDNYVTGNVIKALREKKNITQKNLAEQIGVSDKTISKWESGRGLPDISLLEPLSKALNISLVELISGEYVINKNRSSNMLRSCLYVCPLCGNIIHSMGESLITCCGIKLPVLEAEEAEDDTHKINVERIDNEYYISMEHSMTKQHYISFFAYVTSDKFEIKKLYPEGNAECRFALRGHGLIYAYCNMHGLVKVRI